MKQYDKIAIIGVGLIGGSIGLALKKKGLAKEIVGIGHHSQSVKKAIRLKTIDWGTLDLRSGVKDADIVILATPVLTIPKLARIIAKAVKTGSIVTDVGSVKSYVVKRLEKILPDGVHFVGAHPMAGSEKRGVEKARGDLFRNSICIVTKTKRTDMKALGIIKKLWQDMGAKVIILSPELHDRITSEISHLVHMVIFTVLNSIDKNSLKFASSGFSDTTRIASSDAKIWKDVAISNKTALLKSIGKFRKELSALERAIGRKDSKRLLSIFNKARNKRESFLLKI